MEFRKQKFERQQVLLDGNVYDDCDFNGCELVFAGNALPDLRLNRFDAECRWVFQGAAERTLAFLAGLYHGGGRDLVEATFANIRGAAQPSVPR